MSAALNRSRRMPFRKGNALFRLLCATLGIGAATALPVGAVPLPVPYADQDTNLIYNLLFCDDLDLFRPKDKASSAPWQQLFFNDWPDADAIRSLAEHTGEESRVRALAYHWLRQHDLTVPRGALLGVIVEVPMREGLDVLAVYHDGRVRYINHTTRLAIFEETPLEIGAKVHQLLALSQKALGGLKPWNRQRLPPPATDRVRLSFLASDGLYFGEGAFPAMQRDAMAGPILQQASELLRLVTTFSKRSKEY